MWILCTYADWSVIYLFIYYYFFFLPWKWSIYLLVLSVAKSVQKRFGQATPGPEN